MQKFVGKRAQTELVRRLPSVSKLFNEDETVLGFYQDRVFPHFPRQAYKADIVGHAGVAYHFVRFCHYYGNQPLSCGCARPVERCRHNAYYGADR